MRDHCFVWDNSVREKRCKSKLATSKLHAIIRAHHKKCALFHSLFGNKIHNTVSLVVVNDAVPREEASNVECRWRYECTCVCVCMCVSERIAMEFQWVMNSDFLCIRNDKEEFFFTFIGHNLIIIILILHVYKNILFFFIFVHYNSRSLIKCACTSRCYWTPEKYHIALCAYSILFISTLLLICFISSASIASSSLCATIILLLRVL